jgi:Fe2+ transport system protein FeoA
MFNSLFAFWASPDRGKPHVSARTRSNPPQPLNLYQASSGEHVEVLEIIAGQNATRQLAQLGIRIGSRLAIQRCAPLGGPVLVESAGSTVAIGRGLARKVSVKILP